MKINNNKEKKEDYLMCDNNLNCIFFNFKKTISGPGIIVRIEHSIPDVTLRNKKFNPSEVLDTGLRVFKNKFY